MTNKKIEKDKDISEITKRLDAIIRLQMENLQTKHSMVKLYTVLQESGFTTSDIGKIVNKASNNVSSEIIHYKNDLKKKAGKKE